MLRSNRLGRNSSKKKASRGYGRSGIKWKSPMTCSQKKDHHKVKVSLQESHTTALFYVGKASVGQPWLVWDIKNFKIKTLKWEESKPHDFWGKELKELVFSLKKWLKWQWSSNVKEAVEERKRIVCSSSLCWDGLAWKYSKKTSDQKKGERKIYL